jgi:hypothetical protein
VPWVPSCRRRRYRNRLRQERPLLLLLGHQQRFDLFGGVIARRSHRFHHQPRLPKHFFPRVVLQKTMGDRGRNGQSRA